MLDRALSKLGVCSRIAARAAVHAGRVRVNGKIITQHTHWVTLGRDHLQLDEQPINTAPVQRYLMLHKPAGYVTTRADNLQRPTVFALLPPEILSPSTQNKNTWLFPVGRLDADSEGLLLFTNDGAMSDALTSPASHVYKTYRVLLNHLPSAPVLQQLCDGIRLEAFTTLPARLSREHETSEGAPWLRIAVREGKNRQVRRMFAAVDCEVQRLIRISLGPLQLDDLPLGAWRELTPQEVSALKKACGK